MKITMENFNYKGYRFDRVEFELPQKGDVDEVFKERIMEYVSDSLDEIIEFEREKES